MRKHNDNMVDGRRIVLYNSAGAMVFHGAVEQYDLPHNMADAWSMLYAASEDPDIFPVIVFEGGADIDPELYGEKNTYSHTSDWSKKRDAREVTLYGFALLLQIFIWGNCRGHQLVAALNGGKLHQDLQRCGIWDHYDDSHLLVPTGVLAEIRPDPWEVNSLHHQAVSVIPPNAQSVGEIAGVNEALWYPNLPAMTVQFHPEFMNDVALVYDTVRWYVNANNRNRDRDPKSVARVHAVHSELEFNDGV